MHILLITTGENRVRAKLASFLNASLSVIDCSNEEQCSMMDSRNKRLVQYVLLVKPAILITYRCPYILDKDVFSLPLQGSLNIHPSLLPLYPGLNPWTEFFRNKETLSGVTIHRITEKVDSGEIIMQKSFLLEQTDNIETAREKSDVIAATMIEDLFSSIK